MDNELKVVTHTAVCNLTARPSFVGMRCSCCRSIVFVLRYVTSEAKGLTLCRPGPTALRFPRVTTIPTSPGGTMIRDLARATNPTMAPVMMNRADTDKQMQAAVPFPMVDMLLFDLLFVVF